MGIQINGQTDIISAADGSLSIEGADLTSAINFSVSGVGTIATLIVTGNASIGGTVTYMDVTNVDSVGIITAQQGIQVLTNGINVVGVSTLSGGVNASQGADLARLRVTGITTLSGGVNASQGIDAAGLRVTGIATHGQTTTTGFSNAGVSTLGNATATTLVVSGFSTHGATSATLLSVSGVTTVAAGSVSAPSITPTGDSNTGIFFPSADTIAFGEGGAEALRINSSGNVGIGTDNPLRIIDVRASSSQNPAYILKNTGNTTTGANSALSLSAQTSSTISAGYGPALAFEHRDTSGAYAGALISSLANADPNGADLVLSSRYYGYVEGLRITSSGNVGIGLTNPQAKLDVNGSAQFGSNVVNTTSIQKLFTSSHDATNRTAKIRFGLNDGSFSGIEVENVQGSNSSYNSQTVHIINHNGGVLGDIKSLTARFDGNIGIGTTNPGAKLEVYGSGILLKNQDSNTGIIFQSPRPTSFANVQESGGRGIVESTISVPTSTTTNIAKTHWGGIALIGFAGTGVQGYRLVSFGYNGTPSVLHSVDWFGSLTTTFTISGYTLRVSHTLGSTVDFWVILIGV